MREPRVFRAVRDADRRFVEDDVNAFHDFPDGVQVADVTLDEGDFPAGEGRFEVLVAAPRQVVQDHDFLETFRDQGIGDVGTDESGAAGD